MYKIFILFSSLLFLFIGDSVKASNLAEYKKQEQQINEQREQIKQELSEVDERNKKIKLTMKDNELAAYQEAYKKAIEYIETPITRQQYIFSSFTPVSLSPGELAPREYIHYYKAAGEKYGIDWFVLAAIHKIETDFSRIGLKSMVSTAGAIGHMQFMPATFAAYGVDGDGDGVISPWSLPDAIFSAANYLSISGYSKDVRKAIWHYNHAEWYIDKVLATAAGIKGAFRE
ncbi:lytic murein transglycosylase [Bacillus sp. B15-48]|uniref:lytic transglycosylase domain-containing protein n=1 Tax=Bacillus sp. B15-48 TaxID=1548601 RepID=UPI00193ECD7B|nr:lytic murein transglycosylase [Bacillus sp. B15-48]MBM4765460.1 transglycosylase SLT domain-containing protein [Bacillus sp. B15-48]